MSHTPYPHAGRALRQVTRHSDETSPQAHVTATGVFVKWPQVPDGWGAVAEARVQEAVGPLLEAFRARPVAVPQLVFRPGRQPC